MDRYKNVSMNALELEILDTEFSNHSAKCYLDPRYEYGRRLYYGDGVKEDKREGLYYWEKYCKIDGRARFEIGRCYYEGTVDFPNYEKALDYFKLLESVSGKLWTSKCYLKLKKYEQAFKLLEGTIKQKYYDEKDKNEILMLIGLFYYYGIGITSKNLKRSIGYLEDAAKGKEGNLVAQFYLTKYYLQNEEFDKARYWSLKCFKQNHIIIVNETNELLGVI